MRVGTQFSTGLFELLANCSRYDLLLAVLPVPLVLGGLASAVTGAPTALGVGLGGLPSALLLVYGLFVDTPAPVRGTGRPAPRSGGRSASGGQ
jgi:hypothetical protein